MGQEGFAKGGFIFEALERAQVPFRIYGETLGLLSQFAAGINGGSVASIALTFSDAFGGLPIEADALTVVNGDIETLRAGGVKVDILPALSQVRWLQHLGRQVEHAKRQAMEFGLAGLSALIAAGAFLGRFRVARSVIIDGPSAFGEG